MSYRAILLFVVFALPIIAFAQNITLIYDENSQYQTRFADVFSKQLSSHKETRLTTRTSNSLSIADLKKSQPDVIINLDNATGEKLLSANIRITTFHTLTTLARSRAFAPCLPNCSKTLPAHRFFVLDQPAARQLSLIKLINPGFKTIGVIVTEQSKTQLKPLRKLAAKMQLTLNEHITDSKNVRYQIDDVSKSSDIILAVADTNIYNSNTLSQVLLTSYRYRTPIIGFSKGFVKAGAIAGAVSNIEQLSQHIIERLNNLSQSDLYDVHNIIYPKYFDIISNRNVTKSLNLHFPNDIELQQLLMADEISK